MTSESSILSLKQWSGTNHNEQTEELRQRGYVDYPTARECDLMVS